jgi:hypothetical protein
MVNINLSVLVSSGGVWVGSDVVPLVRLVVVVGSASVVELAAFVSAVAVCLVAV